MQKPETEYDKEIERVQKRLLQLRAQRRAVILEGEKKKVAREWEQLKTLRRNDTASIHKYLKRWTNAKAVAKLKDFLLSLDVDLEDEVFDVE